METIEQSRVFMQKSLTSVNPKIDKYAILLRASPDLKPASRVETGAQSPRMIGLLGTVGDGTEMVYMLHVDFWGKGYMTEALQAFVGKNGIFWDLKERSHIKSLVARIDTENIGSMKTIAKVGAREGELLKKDYALAKDKENDGEILVERLRDLVCWYVDRP